MNKCLALLITLSLLFAATTTHAADIKRGKKLHDQNCLNCHSELMDGLPNKIYIRNDRRIESYAALLRQVGRCKDNLGIAWPEDQVLDVVEYLNTKFYQFEGL
ncbi:MAG: cytochrome c [Gammaproteobacteria bacterium]|nr:cytochrome c [Gammaproteobacteria bacterium]